jgi:hypothetical protein
LTAQAAWITIGTDSAPFRAAFGGHRDWQFCRTIIMQMLAACWAFDPAQIKKFRKEAVNNVRRTRGKVRLDELFWRKDTASL